MVWADPVVDAPTSRPSGPSESLPPQGKEIELRLSERARAAVATATDKAISFSQQAGRTEDVDKWRGRRGKQITESDLRALANECDDLRGHSQLRSAQQIGEQLQIVAEEIKKHEPGISALIQLKLAWLDGDCERYELALRRIDEVFDVLKSDSELSLRMQPANHALRAHYLQKMKKCDEAEREYLRYLKEAKENPESVSRDDDLLARFELADLYADLGAFEKCRAVIPQGERDYYDDSGRPDPQRVAIVLSLNAKLYMSDEKNDLDAAAQLSEQLIDQMQHYYGISSVSYAEAIELQAKVRVAQARFGDAHELLNKALKIRSELLGAEHTSVTRERAEIERVQKLARDSAQSSIEPSGDNGHITSDRYSAERSGKDTLQTAR